MLSHQDLIAILVNCHSKEDSLLRWAVGWIFGPLEEITVECVPSHIKAAAYIA